MKHNNFDAQPQPQTDPEKSAVAKAAMGDDDEDDHQRAPRFHRLSIAAAQNGATIDHEHPPKPHKEGEAISSSHSAKPFVVHPDHPVMKHIQAIHEAVSKDCPDCTK